MVQGKLLIQSNARKGGNVANDGCKPVRMERRAEMNARAESPISNMTQEQMNEVMDNMDANSLIDRINWIVAMLKMNNAAMDAEAEMQVEALKLALEKRLLK